MQIKTLKFQTAMFGNYNYPPTPETMMRVLPLFADLGFMPQLVNIADTSGLLLTPRIQLGASNNFFITLAQDRIDFTAFMPENRDHATFFESVKTFAGRLDPNLKAHRIALVEDLAVQDLSAEQIQSVCRQLLPGALPDSLEFSSRWVSPVTQGGETYNVCSETVYQPGLGMIVNGQIIGVEGVKVMNDVSTTPANTEIRFDLANLGEGLMEISNLINQRQLPFNLE